MKMNLIFTFSLVLLSMGFFEAEVEAMKTNKQLQEYSECIQNIHTVVKSYTKIKTSEVEQTLVRKLVGNQNNPSVEEYFTQDLESKIEDYFCGYKRPELFKYITPDETNKERSFLELLTREDNILKRFLPNLIKKLLNEQNYCSNLEPLFNVIFVKYTAMLESSAFYNCYRRKSSDKSKSGSETAQRETKEAQTSETDENDDDIYFRCKQIFRFLTTFACKGTNMIFQRINICLKQQKAESEKRNSQPEEIKKTPSPEMKTGTSSTNRDSSLVIRIPKDDTFVDDEDDKVVFVGSPSIKTKSESNPGPPSSNFKSLKSFNEMNLYDDDDDDDEPPPVEKNKFEESYERLENFQEKYENMEKAFFHCIIEDGKGKVECDQPQKKNLNNFLETDLLEYFDIKICSNDAKEIASDPVYTRTILLVYEQTDIAEIQEKLESIGTILEKNLNVASGSNMESGSIAVDLLLSLRKLECEKNLTKEEH